MITDKRNNRWLVAAICVVLAGVTFGIYAQVAGFDFVNYDDGGYVYDNSNVSGGLTVESVRWAFMTSYFSNWHPLTWLSHMLDCELFGLKAGYHHLTNVLFHIANTLLLFAVLKRMTGAVWRSAFVAALFALHPVHVESVAWISERKDVLSTFFWILTMFCYARYAEKPGIGRYLAVLVVFIMGLMTKPMLVTLPFVLLLLDFWPLGRFGRNRVGTCSESENSAEGGNVLQWRELRPLILEKIPFFVLTIVSCVVTFQVQRSGGAVTSTEQLPIVIRVVNALTSYVAYISKMLWPVNLGINDLPFRPGMWLIKMAGLGVLLVGVTVRIIRESKDRGYLAVGWLWYLGTLVPVIGLVQVGSQKMSDRYTYVPLIGLFILISWFVYDIFRKRKHHKVVLAILATVVLVALSVCSWRQVQYWQNTETLFTRAVEIYQASPMAHRNLGSLFAHQGRFTEAVDQYELVGQLKPKQPTHFNDLAWILSVNLGDDRQYAARGLTAAKRACELTGYKHPTPMRTLAAAYAALGQFDEAVRITGIAIKIAKSMDYLKLAGLIEADRELYKAGKKIDKNNIG